jgi:hypothetical protein
MTNHIITALSHPAWPDNTYVTQFAPSTENRGLDATVPVFGYVNWQLFGGNTQTQGVGSSNDAIFGQWSDQ